MTAPESHLSDRELTRIYFEAESAARDAVPALIAAGMHPPFTAPATARRAIADAAVRAERERVAALGDQKAEALAAPVHEIRYVVEGEPDRTYAEFREWVVGRGVVHFEVVAMNGYSFGPGAMVVTA